MIGDRGHNSVSKGILLLLIGGKFSILKSYTSKTLDIIDNLEWINVKKTTLLAKGG